VDSRRGGRFQVAPQRALYFCLRDSTAQIKCVVWSRDRRGIPAPPDDGMQVAAFGRVSVYSARAELQFSVLKLEAEGDGLRRKALEITRTRLAADGLLAPERKRALPRYPRVIAMVTSPDGAALQDVIAVLRRRSANVRLVLVPATVQGDTAPKELCAALDRVRRWGKADLVIIGRGGGAREDLSAFNDERLREPWPRAKYRQSPQSGTRWISQSATSSLIIARRRRRPPPKPRLARRMSCAVS